MNAPVFHMCVKEDSAPTQSAASPACVHLAMCCPRTRLGALVSVTVIYKYEVQMFLNLADRVFALLTKHLYIAGQLKKTTFALLVDV